MRVLLLTRDKRHYVLKNPALISGGEVYGVLVAGGTVQVPVSNYAAQEIYEDDDIETFRMRHRELLAAEVSTP